MIRYRVLLKKPGSRLSVNYSKLVCYPPLCYAKRGMKGGEFRKLTEGLFHDPFWVTAQRKNPVAVATRLFFVAETGEISNLDLINDLDKIIKLIEFLSIKE
jgi:hypothetical protein